MSADERTLGERVEAFPEQLLALIRVARAAKAYVDGFHSLVRAEWLEKEAGLRAALSDIEDSAS